EALARGQQQALDLGAGPLPLQQPLRQLHARREDGMAGARAVLLPAVRVALAGLHAIWRAQCRSAPSSAGAGSGSQAQRKSTCERSNTDVMAAGGVAQGARRSGDSGSMLETFSIQ